MTHSHKHFFSLSLVHQHLASCHLVSTLIPSLWRFHPSFQLLLQPTAAMHHHHPLLHRLVIIAINLALHHHHPHLRCRVHLKTSTISIMHLLPLLHIITIIIMHRMYHHHLLHQHCHFKNVVKETRQLLQSIELKRISNIARCDPWFHRLPRKMSYCHDN